MPTSRRRRGSTRRCSPACSPAAPRRAPARALRRSPPRAVRASRCAPRSRRTSTMPRCSSSPRGRPCRTSDSRPSAETVGRRLYALRRMHEWAAAGRGIRSSSSRRCAPRCSRSPTTWRELAPIELVAGGRGHDLSAIAVQLVDLAYARVDMVSRRGEFAVRGGILDVFPPTADHPVRVEFFGDEVEELRAFSVADQRSLPEPIERVVARAESRAAAHRARAPARTRDGARVPEPRRACSRRSPRASPSRAWSRSRRPCSTARAAQPLPPRRRGGRGARARAGRRGVP